MYFHLEAVVVLRNCALLFVIVLAALFLTADAGQAGGDMSTGEPGDHSRAGQPDYSREQYRRPYGYNDRYYDRYYYTPGMYNSGPGTVYGSYYRPYRKHYYSYYTPEYYQYRRRYRRGFTGQEFQQIFLSLIFLGVL